MATHRLEKNNDGGLYKPDVSAVQPGDIFELEGDYAYINLENLNGESGSPIIIRNVGKVQVGTNNAYAAVFNSCSHYVIDGSGAEGYQYGITFGPNSGLYRGGTAIGNSTDVEVKHCEFKHASVGILGNPLTGRTMYNVLIHDNWIHDIRAEVGGFTAEAIYLGNTSITTVNQPAHFENLRIYYNLCEDLGGDGIQFCNAQAFAVYGNTVRDYGKQNLSFQQTGILAGGQSYGTIENNLIQDGTGSAIQVFGYGYNLIKNNRLINTSTAEVQDAIYIEKKNAPDGAALKVDIFSNYIDGAARNGIRNANDNTKGIPGLWKANTIINTVGAHYLTTIYDVIDETPFPQAPALNPEIEIYIDRVNNIWRFV